MVNFDSIITQGGSVTLFFDNNSVAGGVRVVAGLDVDEVDGYIAETAFAEPADEVSDAQAEALIAQAVHGPVVYPEKGEM